MNQDNLKVGDRVRIAHPADESHPILGTVTAVYLICDVRWDRFPEDVETGVPLSAVTWDI